MPTIDDAFLTHLPTSSPSLNSLHLRSSTLGLRSGPLPLLRSMPSFLYPRHESSLDPPSPEGGRWHANDKLFIVVSPFGRFPLPRAASVAANSFDNPRRDEDDSDPTFLSAQSLASCSCTRHPRLLPLPFLPRSPARFTRASCTRFRCLEASLHGRRASLLFFAYLAFASLPLSIAYLSRLLLCTAAPQQPITHSQSVDETRPRPRPTHSRRPPLIPLLFSPIPTPPPSLPILAIRLDALHPSPAIHSTSWPFELAQRRRPRPRIATRLRSNRPDLRLPGSLSHTLLHTRAPIANDSSSLCFLPVASTPLSVAARSSSSPSSTDRLNSAPPSLHLHARPACPRARLEQAQECSPFGVSARPPFLLLVRFIPTGVKREDSPRHGGYVRGSLRSVVGLSLGDAFPHHLCSRVACPSLPVSLRRG